MKIPAIPKSRKWQLSILYKLILTFTVVILPLYFISIITNNWGAGRIKQELSKSILSRVNHYFNTMEAELINIRTEQLNYLIDDNLMMLGITSSAMSTFEQFKSINDLQGKLNVMKNSSNFIKEVRVMIPGISRVISGSRLWDNTPASEFDTIASISQRGSTPLVYWNDRLFMNVYFPQQSLNKDKPPIYTVEVELSIPKIKTAIASLNDYAGNGYLLTSPEGNWSISEIADPSISYAMLEFLRKNRSENIDSGLDALEINGEKYIVVFDSSPYLGFSLLSFVPDNYIIKPLAQYKIWFWVLSGMALIVLLSLIYSIYQVIHKPLHKLIQSFKKVDEGELDISIRHTGNDEFAYVYDHFNIMLDKLKNLIREVYEEKLLAQKAELKQLQSQINPHFLYNSLYMLKSMIAAEDNENALVFSGYLGKYFEFVTRNAADEVPLSFEFEHAGTYVEIQTIRFANQIIATIDPLPIKHSNLRVPRMILQPLIENAYEHGLKNRAGIGLLSISINEEGDMLRITVQDNGNCIDTENLTELQMKMNLKNGPVESTGIINIHYRLRLKFGGLSGLKVSQSEFGGMKVQIYIPLP